MSSLTSNVAVALDEVVDPFLPFTWVCVKSAVSRDPPMSRSFLFGVLIDVFRTVVQSDAVVEGTSVTSDNCAANLEEARAKADVAPNVARTAASTIIEMNCFMDVPPLPFNGFLF